MPAADFSGWEPDESDKVHLFVLIYRLVGCDFLPAMSGSPLNEMWVAALYKRAGTRGVSKHHLFVDYNEMWAVDIDECIKLVVAVFYFNNEAEHLRGGRTAGMKLADVHTMYGIASTPFTWLFSDSAARGLRPLSWVSIRCVYRASGRTPSWAKGKMA